MARTGRPRIPTQLKIIRGNPGRRPIDFDSEPQPDRVAPRCPHHIVGEERQEWRRIVRELKNMGLLTLADRAPLEDYCTNYAAWREAKQKLAEDPVKIYKTETGFPIVSPWKKMMRSAAEDMRKFWTEYGLTPASRTRIRVEKPKSKVDPVEAFQKAKKT